jgi:small subunit ribosomal protein S6
MRRFACRQGRPYLLLRSPGRGRQSTGGVTITKYDLLLLLHSGVEPDRQAEILQRLRTTVEAGNGTVDTVDDWGKKKLAYEINHEAEGIYVDVIFNAEPATLAEVERVLKITDDVLRFKTVRPKAEVSKPA